MEGADDDPRAGWLIALSQWLSSLGEALAAEFLVAPDIGWAILFTRLGGAACLCAL